MTPGPEKGEAAAAPGTGVAEGQGPWVLPQPRPSLPWGDSPPGGFPSPAAPSCRCAVQTRDQLGWHVPKQCSLPWSQDATVSVAAPRAPPRRAELASGRGVSISSEELGAPEPTGDAGTSRAPSIPSRQARGTVARRSGGCPGRFSWHWLGSAGLQSPSSRYPLVWSKDCHSESPGGRQGQPAELDGGWPCVPGAGVAPPPAKRAGLGSRCCPGWGRGVPGSSCAHGGWGTRQLHRLPRPGMNRPSRCVPLRRGSFP